MRIFIAGASGFIGSHIARALIKEGHEVVGGVRNIEKAKQILPNSDFIRCDFTRDHSPSDWIPRLTGIDAVVNAVGIIGEHGKNTFDALHTAAPKALFEACSQTGVKKVVQISAIGADKEAKSHYHLSKKAADDFLAGLDLDWTIVQPSVVYGQGSGSMAMFLAMSALPVIPLVGDGGQRFQPIHIDDLAEGVARIITASKASNRRIEAVGPRPVTFAEMLYKYRQWLGLRKTFSLKAPIPLVRFEAWLGNFIKNSPMNSEALDMLLRGNTGDPAFFKEVTGVSPKSLDETLLENPSKNGDRLQARLFLALPILRLSIALIWIVSGVLPVVYYPVAESYTLLTQAGITGIWQPIMLFGSSALNLILGAATLAGYRMRQILQIQLAVIAVYSIIIALRLPEFLAHPFGPVIKNIPIAAGIVTLILTEED